MLRLVDKWDAQRHPRDADGRFVTTGSLTLGDRSYAITLPARAAEAGDRLVPLDVAAFDARFAKDEGFYIGPGGHGGTIGTRYQRVGQFLSQTDRLDAPEVYVGPDGEVGFTDGRHRFAYLRDQGVKIFHVAMTPESAKYAKQHGYLALTQKRAHHYGNTQIAIPEDSSAAASLNAARAEIADDDLMADGKDVDPNHVTVRYGLQNDDLDKLRAFLAAQQPFEARVLRVELFPASEYSEGAVPVVARIASPELRAIEREIGEHADFKEKSFPTYKPHCTLAYCKPEKAERYRDLYVDGSFVVEGITISHASGEQEEIRFGSVQKYDPAQPRDAKGQWTEGGLTGDEAKAAIRRGEPHLASEQAFVDYHVTGYIEPDAYKRYEEGDLSFIHKDEFDTLLETRTVNGEQVEIRVQETPLRYPKYTEEAPQAERDRLYEEYVAAAKALGTDPMSAGIDLGWDSPEYASLDPYEQRFLESGSLMVRDEQGNAVYYTPEEMRAKGLPEFGYTVGAFVGDKAVGYSGDEFGATGVYLAKPYQRHGIGLTLLKTYLEKSGRLKRGTQIGQMTPQGKALTRALHRQLVREARQSVAKYDPEQPRDDHGRFTDRLVERFKQALPPGTMGGMGFLLPDATHLGFREETHDKAAQALGVDLYKAIAAGIIRTHGTAVEIGAPITKAQAQWLMDLHTATGSPLDVDVFNLDLPRDQQRTAASFGGLQRVSADRIRHWVNGHFTTQKWDESQHPRDAEGQFTEGYVQQRLNRLKKILPVATTIAQTSFLLPDGTRLRAVDEAGHHAAHDTAIGKYGFTLSGLENLGVVRYVPHVGVEIGQPLTRTQADILAADWLEYNTSIVVETVDPVNRELFASKEFVEPDGRLLYEYSRNAFQKFRAQKADPEGRFVTPFVSFDKQGDEQLRMIASLNASRLATWGFTAEAEVRGITRYKLTAVLDARTSKFCRFIDGRVFEVEDGREKVLEVLRVQNPNDLRVVQPWPKQTKADMAMYAEMTDDEFVARGWHIPPYHPHCRTVCVMATGEPKKTPSPPPVPGLSEQTTTADTFAEIGVPVSPEDVAQWNDYIGVSPVEMLAKLGNVTLPEVFAGKLGTSPIAFMDDLISVKARGINEGVKYAVGTVLDPFTGTYYLSQAELTGDATSAAKYLKRLYRALVEIGQSTGMDAVSLAVAGSLVPYVSMGFLPDGLRWNLLRTEALQRPDLAGMLAALSEDDALLVRHLLMADDPMALQALVDLGLTYEGLAVAEWLFPEVSGTFSLDLTDDLALAQFREYLS